MPRVQIECRTQLSDRIGHPIDSRQNRSERIARVGPFRHPHGDDLELRRGVLQIAGLVLGHAELIVSDHRVRLQLDCLL